jgi:hypothetical protein
MVFLQFVLAKDTDSLLDAACEILFPISLIHPNIV